MFLGLQHPPIDTFQLLKLKNYPVLLNYLNYSYNYLWGTGF